MKILQLLIINLFIFNASSCIKKSKEELRSSGGMQWDSSWDAKAKKAKEDEPHAHAKAQPTVYFQADPIGFDNETSLADKFNTEMTNSFQGLAEVSQQNNFENVCDEAAQIYTPNAIALLENGNLTEVQLDCFGLFTQTQWQDYFKYVLKENSPQVFQCHTLYQFPHFRQAIKSLPGYDQAMVDLYNRLDSNSRTSDKKLSNSLKYLPVSNGVYECLNNSGAVHARIAQQGAEYAHWLSKGAIECQIEQVRHFEENRNANVTNIADQLKLELLDQQIAQCKRNIADWESKNSQTLSVKTVNELSSARINIQHKVNAVDQKLLAVKDCLNKANAEYEALKKAHPKAKGKEAREIGWRKDGIDSIKRQQAVLQAKRDCLQEQYEQVQVYEYLAQHNYGLDSQDRIDALHGKNISQHLVLTPQAQKFIQDIGLDNKLLSYTPRTHLQMQSQQEVISLINKVVDQRSHYYDINAKNLFDVTGQLARAAFDASKHGDIIQSWALTDIGNCTIDYVTTQAFVMPENPIQSVAIRDGLNIVVHDITHPVETLTNVAKSAVVLSDLIGVGASLDPEGTMCMLSQLPLEQRIEKYIETAKKLDAIGQAIRSMSADDVVRELVVGVVEGQILGAAFRGMGTISQLAKNQLQTTAAIIQDSARGAKVLSTIEGLEMALNAIDAEIVSFEENIAREIANSAANSVDEYIPLMINPEISLGQTIIQEAPLMEVVNETLTNTIKKQFENFQTNPEFRKQIDKLHALKESLPKCEVHDVVTQGGKHIHVPDELKGVITNVNIWEQLAKVYDGARLTPAKCGEQASIWFNYQHILSPEIKANCKTGETRIAGFHHDYLGKIRESGVLKYSEIKQQPHGFYFVEKWSYQNSKSKPSGFFPDHWTPSKVMSKIEEALKNNPLIEFDKRGNWTAVGKISEGIDIKIVFETDKNLNPTGKIITAYPVFN